MTRYLPEDDNNIDCKVVVARALNNLLLCHMFLPTDCVWNYLHVYTMKEVYSNYDIKVLLACIEREIFKELNLQVLAQMITIAANAIAIFRKK